MADIRHFFEGKQIQEPRNWKGVKIKADWQDKKEVAVDVTTLNFVGTDAVAIIARAKESIFEGSKYKIEFGKTTDKAFVFHGNLDYADEFTEIGCNECLVKVKKEQGYDWINERADGISFPYLYQIGIITDADFIQVPYVINYIPDNMQLLTLSISVFMLTKETIETVKSISDTTRHLIEAVIPTTPSPAPSWLTGKFIGLALKGLVETAYAIALSIAIAKLLQEIVEQLLPKKRYHLGMKVSTLFERGCEQLGLGFASDQLGAYGDMVLIPSKGFKGGSPEPYDLERGFPSVSDSVYTFGDLIRTWQGILNSDFSIEDGVLRFERRDYWKKEGDYLLPDIYNDQDKLERVTKYNTFEAQSNYNINFAIDTQDQNTLENQDRRIYQNTLEIVSEKSKKFNNLKNLTEVTVPYSLAVRKNELTAVEKALKGLLKVGDSITGRTDSMKIKSRVGAMHLSSHFITGGKLVIMDGSELKTNQRDLLNAQLLWNREHYINSFTEIDGVHNQYKIYEGMEVPFCEDDFKKLVENQFFTDNFGNFGKVDTLEWLPYENKATINYRINTLYASNLTIREL